MKKLILAACALLVVFASAMTVCKVHNKGRLTSFMKVNLEALADNESGRGNIMGQCNNYSYGSCMYTCRECGSHWFKPDQTGVVISISGYCDCGARASIHN